MNKNINEIKKEVMLQKKASKYGISPKILDYDINGRYIVMEKLDTTLYDIYKKQNKQLTIKQQKKVIRLFQKLDNCGIFHGDPNPLNIMCKGSNWYMIDFGLSEEMTLLYRKKHGDRPNMKYMPLGMVIKFKELFGKSNLTEFNNIIHTIE